MGKRSNASKFPVARIKKMMQADEDIGKVAQATPVVISKALELFLADIVTAAAKETQSKGSRKVTAYHLKRAIHTTPTLDFLKEHVAHVADPVGAEPLSAASAPAPAGGSAKRSGDADGEEDEKKAQQAHRNGSSGTTQDAQPSSSSTSASGREKRVKRE